MNRLILSALLATAASPVLAVGQLADVNIVDRDTGEALRVHYHRGEHWVAGRPGARYAISIRNQQGRRLLAVTSVDGVNVITGKTAKFDQNGYIYDPWVGYEIAGWRKSNAEVAAFNFTALPNSYAAQTGRPQNVGVIGVALFPEARRLEPQITYENATPRLTAPTAADESRQDAAGATAAPQAAPDSIARARSEKAESSRRLGTGHGARESSWVTQVDFERESQSPSEIIRIRYDSRQNLIAMGVIRQPRPTAHVRAFPGEQSAQYVPDP
jgi:hypothetical protein